MSCPRVLVIGAGISGLSTAWWLARQGMDVEIWEADSRPGGKIRSRHENGYLTEDAAALLVNFRPEVDHLVAGAGLASSRLLRNDGLKRYVLHRGKLRPVPMFLPALLASSLWTPRGKLRLMAEAFIPRGGHEGESVTDFIIRRLGREVLDTTMDAFVSGTLASDPDLAEARSVLPRLTTLEDRYGSLAMGMFVNRVLKRRRANKADTFSFRGGMSQLVESLAHTPGLDIRYRTSALAVHRMGDAWQVLGDGPQGTVECHTPHLVLSIPAPACAALLHPLDNELGQLLGGIEYAPVAVLHLGLSRRQIGHPLDGSGFLSGSRAGLAVNGNLWMSQIFPQRAPAGKVLLTSYLGGVRHPGHLDQDDDKLVEESLHSLAPLLNIHGAPEQVSIRRHFRGLPLYHGHYRARLAQVRRQLQYLPGLHINGNFMEGISVRERIFQGERLARIISKSLPQGSTHPRKPPLPQTA